MSQELHAKVAVLESTVVDVKEDIKQLKGRSHETSKYVQNHEILLKNFVTSLDELVKSVKSLNNLKYWLLGSIAAGSFLGSIIVFTIKYFPDILRLMING